MHLTSRGVIEDTLVNLERTAEATDRTGDHAGFVETSLMMALLPDHVDLERIRHRHPDNLYDDPLEGISESERPVVTANVEDGRTCSRRSLRSSPRSAATCSRNRAAGRPG